MTPIVRCSTGSQERSAPLSLNNFNRPAVSFHKSALASLTMNCVYFTLRAIQYWVLKMALSHQNFESLCPVWCRFYSFRSIPEAAAAWGLKQPAAGDTQRHRLRLPHSVNILRPKTSLHFPPRSQQLVCVSGVVPQSLMHSSPVFGPRGINTSWWSCSAVQVKCKSSNTCRNCRQFHTRNWPSPTHGQNILRLSAKNRGWSG